MKQSFPLVLLLAFGLLGCAARDAQHETVAEDKMLHPWPMTLKSDEASRQALDGQREWDMLRFDQAEAHFKRAVAIDSSNAVLYALLATSSPTQVELFSRMAKARSLGPSANEADRLAVEAFDLLSRNEARQALPKAQQLTRVLPDHPRSWMLLATADSIVNGVPAFRRDLHKAAEVAPDYAPPLLVLAYSYSTSDPIDLAAAEKAARRALELLPNEPQSHDLLGDVLRASGRLEEAAKEYTRETELDPTRGDGLQQRAHVNSFLGHYAEARADYDAAVAASPPTLKIPLGMYRANVHLFEGNLRAGYEEFEKNYALVDATHAPAPDETKLGVLTFEQPIVLFGHMVPETESVAARTNELTERIAASVGSPEMKRYAEGARALGRSYVALVKGQFAAAEAAARDYVRINNADNEPEKARPAHQALGLIAFEQKKYDVAVRELTQADPDDMFTVYYLAMSHEALGHKPEAEKLYRRIASFNFNSPGIGIVRREAIKKLKAIA
jgi:tetratricopeptide (TPR) repeat protein